MAKPHIVQMRILKEVPTQINTEAYLFKPVGRFKGLKTRLWNWLGKHGCLKSYYESTSKIQTINIDRRLVFDKLMTGYMSSFPYGKRPTQVFVGPEEFSELLADPRCMEIFQPIRTEVEGKYNGLAFGLPLTLVPHMKGVLIV